MITVHHLENSRSQRVLWLLEELGIDYVVKRYERNPETLLAPRELKAVHPLGKSPVVSDGGLVIAESGAIVNYLVEVHGGGHLGPPEEGSERWRYRHWLHHAEGSAMPPLVMKLVFTRIPKRLPALLRPLGRGIFGKAQSGFIDSQIRALLAYWEDALTPSGWFAGAQFSAADVMMSFPVKAAAHRFGVSDRPRLADFLARIHARPAYWRALKRGGPYAYA